MELNYGGYATSIILKSNYRPYKASCIPKQPLAVNRGPSHRFVTQKEFLQLKYVSNLSQIGKDRQNPRAKKEPGGL